MFVENNTIKAIQNYFKKKLSEGFTNSEIQVLFDQAMNHYLGLSALEAKVSDRRLSESELLAFRSYVRRLLQGEPYQYILGKTFFYNIELRLAKGVLIPRPETEELVDWIIQDNQEDKLHVLDVGFGSGAITLALAYAHKQWSIHGVDVSEDALRVALMNAENLKLNVDLKLKDVLHEEIDGLYDIIVSNPPYVLESDKKQMAANVLSYEPHVALFVPNEDPLKFYKRIGELATNHLNSNGKLYFEIHEDFGVETREMLEQLGYEQIEIRKDLQGKDRMVKAIKS